MYRYEAVSRQVREWIDAGVLRPGDRLISVREMSERLGYSTVTVHQAYGRLQDEGILEVRPRSGFFISRQTRQLPEFTSDGVDFVVEEEANLAENQTHLPPSIRQMEIEGFGSSFISADLLPYDDLYRLMSSGLRWEAARLETTNWQGLESLREIISRRVSTLAPARRAREIIITRDIGDSLRLCLNLLTRPGSKVIVETPTDAATVSAVLGRALSPIEIYSHPRYGVDPEQFQYLLDNNDIDACILSPNNHVPTGVSYPPDNARRIMEAATIKDVPIIESVASQELLYGTQAFELAQFDTRNLVLKIGGFADTLGPRFGVSWIAVPVRYRTLLAAHLAAMPLSAGEWARQKAIAEFIARRSYDRHLRKLREALSARMRKGLSRVFQTFPEHCTVSRPTGGYICWVRGPTTFSAVATAARANPNVLGYLPGPLFSVTRAFGNFLALNLSFPWTAEREAALDVIGKALLKSSN